AKIALDLKLDAPVDTIKADPTQIEQVIMNLTINARDAMPKGGILTIQTSEHIVTEVITERENVLQPGKYLAISVKDTGSGMAPDIREKIFEPFFTTKEEGKGTGLGLPIVDGIISQFGGAPFCQSEPAKG